MNLSCLAEDHSSFRKGNEWNESCSTQIFSCCLSQFWCQQKDLWLSKMLGVYICAQHKKYGSTCSNCIESPFFRKGILMGDVNCVMNLQNQSCVCTWTMLKMLHCSPLPVVSPRNWSQFKDNDKITSYAARFYLRSVLSWHITQRFTINQHA